MANFIVFFPYSPCFERRFLCEFLHIITRKIRVLGSRWNGCARMDSCVYHMFADRAFMSGEWSRERFGTGFHGAFHQQSDGRFRERESREKRIEVKRLAGRNWRISLRGSEAPSFAFGSPASHRCAAGAARRTRFSISNLREHCTL